MDIQLAEFNLEGANPDISEVQLLRAGKFTQYDGCVLEITPDMLRNMKRNFDANVKKVKLAVDYFHMSHAEAAGWISEVLLKEGDNQLWLKVEWTEKAKEKILSKEILYLSADFDLDYTDNETGQKHGATLNGGGLTNRPFVKGMAAVLSESTFAPFDKNGLETDDNSNSPKKISRKPEEAIMNFSDLKKEIVVLSEAQKSELGELMGLAPKDVKLSEENASLKTQLAAKDQEAKTLSEQLATQKKEAEFSVLLSDGKAVEAQKAAYMSGNMSEFVKLAVAVNLSESGTGAPKIVDKSGEPKTAEEAEAKVEKLAEEKRAADKNLSVQASISAVLSEHPNLKKLIA